MKRSGVGVAINCSVSSDRKAIIATTLSPAFLDLLYRVQTKTSHDAMVVSFSTVALPNSIILFWYNSLSYSVKGCLLANPRHAWN